MEFLNLISGDNLFKYCFTLGLVMVVFAMVYPLEKKHQIQLEIISYNKEAELLKKDIESLNKGISDIEAERNFLMSQVKAVGSGQKVDKDKLKKRTDKFNVEFLSLRKYKRDLDTKLILLNYNRNKIEVLNTQANTFGIYSFWLAFFGIGLIIFGFIFWTKNTFFEMKNKATKK